MNYSITTLIDQLPEQARRTLLYSLVGSLNARVIGGCSRIVDGIRRRDSDVSTEVVNDFNCTADEARARAELGTGHDTWLDLLALASLRDHLHLLLITEVNDDAVLPYSDTMRFMTSGEVRSMPKETLEQLAAALDCGITADDLARINAMDQVQQRATMAAKSQDIMHILHSLPTRSTEDADESFDALAPDTQASVLERVEAALNKARDNALLAVMRRSRNASLSDIPLINAAIKEVGEVLNPAGLSDEEEATIREKHVADHESHLNDLGKTARRKAGARKAAETRRLRRVSTGEEVIAPSH